MTFAEVYGRTRHDVSGLTEAAEILGVPERTFRRWRDRREAGGEGLYSPSGPGVGQANTGAVTHSGGVEWDWEK